MPWILIAAGLLAYANSFTCPFLFDDVVVITSNQHIYHPWPPWKAVLVPTRWVADYSFALNYAWAGFSPPDFRLVNILIHIGAALLLFGFLRRTLLLPRWNGRFNRSAAGLAFATALLWVVHPLQTESVTYIAQRIESLMGFFFLLAFYCLARSFASDRPRRWRGAAILACAIGMGTKEVMIAAPVLLFLYDALLVSDSWRSTLSRWKLHAAFFATWLVLAGLLATAVILAKSGNIELASAGYAGDNLQEMATAQPDPELAGPFRIRWQYALTQLNVLAHYLKLSFIPSPLCLDYMWPFVQSAREALWPGSLTFLLGLGTLWALWRRSWLGFPGAWFFIILAPTSSFSPLPDAAFEHRMYLPLAGVLTLAVLAVHAVANRLIRAPRPRLTATLSLLLIATVALGTRTYLRNEDYQSQERMWRDVIRSRPDNFRTHIALASALIDKAQYGDAASVCSNMLDRLPPLPDAGTLSAARFDSPDQHALHLYYAMAHNNLGVIAMAQTNYPVAKGHYREALSAFPGIYLARRNLGLVHYYENDAAAAIREFLAALECRPHDTQTLCFLAMAYSRNKAYKEAAAQYRKAIDLKPDFWFARTQLAWLRATCPEDEVRNGPLALAEARELIRTTGGGSAKALDIAAAAYAEIGDFTNAVRLARQALERIGQPAAAGSKPSDLNESDIRQRLELYQSGKPHRE